MLLALESLPFQSLLNQLIKPKLYCFFIACENIRFSSLFAAGEVSRGETGVYFSRVFLTSEDSPLAGVFKGARISFLPTAVFYVKVRLIYKLCCYLGIFVSLKATTYLYQCSKVQLCEGTKYELPKDGFVGG